MINEYTKELSSINAKNNIPKELIEMQTEYRENGVPTILTDGLNELLLMLSIKNPKTVAELLGVFDENLNAIMSETGVVIFLDGDNLIITGEKDSVILAEKVVKKLDKDRVSGLIYVLWYINEYCKDAYAQTEFEYGVFIN